MIFFNYTIDYIISKRDVTLVMNNFSELKSLANNAKIGSLLKFLLIRYTVNREVIGVVLILLSTLFQTTLWHSKFLTILNIFFWADFQKICYKPWLQADEKNENIRPVKLKPLTVFSTRTELWQLTVCKHVLAVGVAFRESDGQYDILIGRDGENGRVLIAPVVIIRVLLKGLKPAKGHQCIDSSINLVNKNF